ncbi:D-amino acid dehydrogenase [Xylophilus sp.]|uniref:D-amino acid dehydrogenase n=1 Tax=Xylophilus sp. TaxID=2653893 RepID=UPI002D80D2AE|nr:D-amino acid dehydrogenase [Xylophilus sp.]
MAALSPTGAAPSAKRYWTAGPQHPPGRFGHVTVIGAGIVGLTTAAALRRSGRSVTVLDAASDVGRGTSFGNGCQLSYGYVAPLAQPGLLAELPQLLFARSAPLKIVPRASIAQWRWMLQFLLACRASRAHAGSLALLALGALSRQETDLWLADADTEALSFSRHGKLVLLPTDAALHKARAQLALQAPCGPLQTAVSEVECLRIEPALARLRGQIAGAIHTPSECAIDSHALCRDLEHHLKAQGVDIVLGTAVREFRRTGDQVTHLVTDAGVREVDGLVIAAGPASAAMARQLGFPVPVYPLKGYSITVPVREPCGAPHVSVTDAGRKVVYARIGARLRVAGVAEIGGYDARVDARRIRELSDHTRQAFGSAVDLDAVEPWAGLRPATPTSVPIVGPSPRRNVFLNIGHGALGLTLAFGSARRLVDLLDAA